MPDKTVDPLLVDVLGHEASLLGNEAIVRGALEAGVVFASGYPGTPSSEVTDSFARVSGEHGVVFEYSVNEKIALEMAFAASLAGARSICAMKHLGLMYAGDPISTIPYVGVEGGMVIVSAGDPSCLTSPNEQDQRHLGAMLHVPVLDPSTPGEAYWMAKAAFELSEKSRLPVILRITTRVCHSRATIRYGRLGSRNAVEFVRDPQKMTPIPMNARRMRQEIPARLEAARAWMSEAKMFRQSGSGKRAVLATGAPAATVRDVLREEGLENDLVMASIGGVFPLPVPELLSLLAEVDSVLVVEELSPFIEDSVRALCKEHGLQAEVLGKRTGHFPVEFEYLPAVIRRGLKEGLGLDVLLPAAGQQFEPVVPRPPNLCPGCPHRSTFFAARAAFGDDQLYFNDIGCYTLGYGDPLGTVDGLLCMGAGFTLAAGVARVTGRRTVGFVGDSTFFHSGMAPLLNAIKENVNMVAVILDNQVTGMTGFQESPTVSVSADGGKLTREVSIEGVARALGASHVETVKPSHVDQAIAAFERARDGSGVSVIIAEEPCPQFVGRLPGHDRGAGVTYEIDQDRCQTCGRELAGLRCDGTSSVAFERQMARSRALEVDRSTGSRQCVTPEPVAPCALRCPIGLCIQGYAGHVAAGQYREALDLIMSRCPLPHSVCRVCHKPCETACVRGETDEPVAINDLKRFVMDWAAREGEVAKDPAGEERHGRRVAVVGAGPAGLSAAHDLILRGYEVLLYDELDRPGGLLRTGIPPFRLPREALDADIDRILAMGVGFEGGKALGRDMQLDDLLAEGHDAVLIGLGAHRALGLGLAEPEGGGGPEIVDALAYLAAANDGAAVSTGERVAVIGGGNAAIDAARTARRLGARQVSIVYRRRRGEMPALVDEIREAEIEGIELRVQLQPVALVQADTGGGLRCIRTEPGEPDASGRQRPVPVAGSETVVEVDQVIVAIGQSPLTEFLTVGGEPIERESDGSLKIDAATGQTSNAQVFAGGDIVSGERTVTAAIAEGQRAAWGVDVVLRGQAAADRLPPPPSPGSLPVTTAAECAGHIARVDRSPRRRPAELPPEARTGFDENVAALTEEQARAEASRCAVCGMCGNCRSCLDLFGCPAFHVEGGRIEIDALLCNGCGVCAEFCPNGAIRPSTRSES